MVAAIIAIIMAIIEYCQKSQAASADKVLEDDQGENSVWDSVWNTVIGIGAAAGDALGDDPIDTLRTLALEEQAGVYSAFGGRSGVLGAASEGLSALLKSPWVWLAAAVIIIPPLIRDNKPSNQVAFRLPN